METTLRGRVAGKVALVTGAAKGLGEATALLLAREGAQVAVTDIDEEGGRRVTQSIVDSGADAIFIPLVKVCKRLGTGDRRRLPCAISHRCRAVMRMR